MCQGFLIRAKTEGLIIEIEFLRDESGVRVLGEGQQAHSPPARGSGGAF